MTQSDSPMNAAERGRADLAAWLESQEGSFFEPDIDLQRGLQRLYGDRYPAMAETLRAAGAGAAAIDALVCEIESRHSLPRLERYDGIGRRTEGVVFDQRYDTVGAQLYGCGSISVLSEPGNLGLALALG